MQNEYLKDINPEETNEWLEALENIIEEGGPKRAHYILEKLIDKARRKGTYLPFRATTAYLNSIDVEDEPKMPGDRDIERRIRSANKSVVRQFIFDNIQNAKQMGSC